MERRGRCGRCGREDAHTLPHVACGAPRTADFVSRRPLCKAHPPCVHLRLLVIIFVWILAIVMIAFVVNGMGHRHMLIMREGRRSGGWVGGAGGAV